MSCFRLLSRIHSTVKLPKLYFDSCISSQNQTSKALPSSFVTHPTHPSLTSPKSLETSKRQKSTSRESTTMATSTGVLDDGQKPPQPNNASSGFLDAKREESDLEHGSTRAPSMALDRIDYEKERSRAPSESDSHDEKTRHNAVANLEGEPPEYPQGAKMVFIVIALIMSIFLVSLDMVCSSTPSFFHNR